MKRGTPVKYMAVDTCEKVMRNVFCRNYSECLDEAITKKWPGFSCQGCESYEREMLEGDELNDDYERCVALAFVSGAVDIGAESRA
ncbi:MAG: hypothetical protein AAGU11_02385 [Syntrophobacteraceae bacterium]